MSTSYPCTGHIVSNGYKLIDVTGQPTRWGVWSPDQLNLNQSWADEHGLNSLQMLTFLLSAFHVTKNNSYWNTWKVCAVVQIGIYIVNVQGNLNVCYIRVFVTEDAFYCNEIDNIILLITQSLSVAQARSSFNTLMHTQCPHTRIQPPLWL